MMEQVIKLVIKDQTITKLAGYVLGRDLFQKQVEGKVDLNKAFTIEFPSQIDFLASSFIQGFFGEINRAIGIDGVQKNMDIISNVPNVKNRVVQGLMTQ